MGDSGSPWNGVCYEIIFFIQFLAYVMSMCGFVLLHIGDK